MADNTDPDSKTPQQAAEAVKTVKKKAAKKKATKKRVSKKTTSRKKTSKKASSKKVAKTSASAAASSTEKVPSSTGSTPKASGPTDHSIAVGEKPISAPNPNAEAKEKPDPTVLEVRLEAKLKPKPSAAPVEQPVLYKPKPKSRSQTLVRWMLVLMIIVVLGIYLKLLLPEETYEKLSDDVTAKVDAVKGWVAPAEESTETQQDVATTEQTSAEAAEVEASEPSLASTAEAPTSASVGSKVGSKLKPLPESQLLVIQQVFAPEMGTSDSQ